jgi:hypothetical protein
MTENVTASPVNDTLDLKPCPFCGAQPRVMEIEDEGYRLWCHCGIETFPVLDKDSLASIWNHRFDADLQKLIEGVSDSEDSNGRRASALNSKIYLKPCPFCGAQPELLPCPNPDDEGYLVRCLCDSCFMVSKTVLQPTIEAAADAWNVRTSDHSSASTSYLKTIPFQMYACGTLLAAVGSGLHSGISYFFTSLGLAVMVGSVLLTVFTANERILND